MRTTVTRYYHYVGLNGSTDFLNFRQQSFVVGGAEAQLLGSKAYVGIGYTRQLFDFVFHFGSAVGTAKVLQNIYAFYLIGIRHTAGAISQAFAAYITVFFMRMTDFAITVGRMTGNVMSMSMFMLMSVVVSATAFVAVRVSMFMLMSVVVSATAFVTMCMRMSVVMSAAAFITVCVSVLMSVVMSATAFVTVRVGMFMLVAVVMSATAFVTVRVSVLMSVVVSAATFVTVCVSVLMAVVVSAATFVTMCMSVFVLMSVVVSTTTLVAVCMRMFFMLMAVVVSTAAVITMLMGMLFMVMFMVMAAAALITMSMLGHMSHSFVIMVLAAVTAGAAFRMLAVIFYTINMTVDVSESSYIAGTVADIFQILLHYIYHLSSQVVSLFI